MKKMKVLLTALAIFVASASWAQSGYRINSSSGANLRQGPGADNGVITTIPNGANVRVIERTNDKWVKVEYNGKTGYVSSELVSQDANNNRNNNNSRNNNKNASGNSSKSKSNNQGRSNNASRNGSSNYSSAASRNWGVGLRLGDPTGVTVKKYNGSSAWELSVGSSPNFGFYHYDYDRRFYYYDYKDYKLIRSSRTLATSLQLHYLKHTPIADGGNLQFYYGGGGQVRLTNVHYWYEYNGLKSVDRRTYVDLGLDGKLGLEYTFADAPFSIFVDATLYLELYYKPVWATGMGGVGARYNF